MHYYQRHNIIQFLTITVMLIIALYPGFITAKSFGTKLMCFTHMLSLICFYLALQQMAKRIYPRLSHMAFLATGLLLGLEIAINYLTTLHLNRFALSLIVQPNAIAHIGLSIPIVVAVLIVPVIILFSLAYFTRKTGHFFIATPWLTVAFILSICATQGLFSLLHYKGTYDTIVTKRQIAFFAVIPPHLSRAVLTPILGERPKNPFALQNHSLTGKNTSNEAINLVHKKNILFIVVDSLRSKDILATPALTPNLMIWSNQGWLSLNHKSVSNCTHFGFYTLFTGKPAIHFGDAREGRPTQSLGSTLTASGYHLSTSESLSLDWYDTAAILFPGAHRKISDHITASGRDSFVTEKTLDTLLADNTNSPFFHIAYYSGTHYDHMAHQRNTPYERYRDKLGDVDAEIGKLLRNLEAANKLKNTLVIITSDHGEEFLHEGAFGHSSRLSDEQVTVPLLVLGGNGEERQIKSHSDIVPYILSLLTDTPYRRSPTEPVTLANCDYSHPNGYAVLSDDGRVDFDYTEGELNPIPSPDGTMANRAQQIKAAAYLLSLLRNS